MATTIINLFNSIELNTILLKTVKWGQPLDSHSIGIYVISICSNPDSNSNLFNRAPIDNNLLNFWVEKASDIQVDKRPASVENLRQRLNSFWLPDENIIYIGQTESRNGLKGRVRQFYNSELGDKKPHAGGHWIKTLQNLNQLFVHYLPVQNPSKVEEQILRAFISQVSESTKNNLYDKELLLPFANLELGKGNRKKHGISKSTIDR